MLEALFPPGWSTLKKLMWLLLTGAGGAGWKWATVTGNPVTLSNAVAGPLKQLKIEFSPVQDLHGYDSPWPAGGGKNKLDPYEVFDDALFYTVKSNGDVIVLMTDSRAWSSITPVSFKAGTYTFSGDTTGWSDVRLSTEDYATPHIINSSIDKTTFTLSEDGYIKLKAGYNASSYPFTGHFQIEEGSNATSYAPYANECPISGWTGVNVWQDGKNLAEPINTNPTSYSVDSNGVYTQNNPASASWANSMATALLKETLPAGTYTASFFADTIAVDASAVFGVWDASGKIGSISAQNLASGNVTFTLTEETEIGICAKMYAGAFKFQIELGSTASAYEPYDPGSLLIPVVFPDGETYYSGWADPTTGDGLGTWASVSKPWSEWIAQGGDYGDFNLRAINISDAAAGYGGQMFGKALSNETNFQEFSTNPKLHFYFATNKLLRYFLPKTFEESKNVQVAYELAEPIPFHVDPQSISSLEGTNTMWTDAGPLTVEYRKDGNVSDAEALSMLLGGRYTPATGPEDVSDAEALSIITGGNR